MPAFHVSEPEPGRASEPTYAHRSMVASPATQIAPPMARSATVPLLTCSTAPAAGGLPAPPPAPNAPLGQGVEQGLIAVRAMRLMRLLGSQHS